MRYSVQARDGVFIKGYGFLSFAQNIGKNVSKTEMVNTAKNFLIILKSLQQLHLKPV